MDGSGMMTFPNTTINADFIKIGVFGANGSLVIGGGRMTANTLLHLYAPGSNGSILFNVNTTLDSRGSAAVIAANTVTIATGAVVTIAGQNPANVYTNNPNYTGSGGNGSAGGTFGGAGATTQPLSSAPPFARSASARPGRDGKVRISADVHGHGRNAPAPDTRRSVGPIMQLHRSPETKARAGFLAVRTL